jgi:aminoglycoside phosphotransferase (APT) family kinase protein
VGRQVDRRVGLDGSVVEVIETADGLRVVQHDAAGGPPHTFRPADDPALPGLGALLDPKRQALLLERALGAPVQVVATELVRYRAGRRATVRIVLADGPASVLYAKAFHDGAKATATARSLAHLTEGLPHGAPLRLPTLAGFEPGSAVVVLGAVEGDPVRLPPPLGPHGPGAPDVRSAADDCRRIGLAVATLHRLDHAPLPPRPVSADLDKTAIRIGQLAPGPLRQRLGTWFERIGATVPAAVGSESLVAVHGDCKPAQVLLGQVVGLLDPDHLGIGDAAGDLAQFHVSLLQAAVRSVLAADAATAAAQDCAGQLIEAFDAGYATGRAAADPGLAERVRWFEQLTLLRKAVRSEARRPGDPAATLLADLGGAPV